jgi:hypothetical protein
VYLLQGFYVVTYGLAIYTLNLLIGFLSPMSDPDENDGTELPINAITPDASEWKPFMRKVPEFKFWYEALQGQNTFNTSPQLSWLLFSLRALN